MKQELEKKYHLPDLMTAVNTQLEGPRGLTFASPLG